MRIGAAGTLGAGHDRGRQPWYGVRSRYWGPPLASAEDRDVCLPAEDIAGTYRYLISLGGTVSELRIGHRPPAGDAGRRQAMTSVIRCWQSSAGPDPLGDDHAADVIPAPRQRRGQQPSRERCTKRRKETARHARDRPDGARGPSGRGSDAGPRQPCRSREPQEGWNPGAVACGRGRRLQEHLLSPHPRARG